MENDNVSDEAKALSERGAAKGGRARAQRLSPAERSEAARTAAQVAGADRPRRPTQAF